MALKLEKLYNIYEERYLFALGVIEDFHRMVEKGEYHKILDSGEKLGVHILNRNLDQRIKE